MVGLMGIGSLAVDYGRVQLAKTELQTAIDAASRAAAAYLPTDPTGARTAAIALAAAHTVDGQTLVLQSSDIQIGKWNSTTGVLDTSSSSPDSVRITGYRTSARGNPISLTLTRSFGFSNFDLSATCTAMGASAPANYQVVGLTSITMAWSTWVGTYDSSSGAYTTGTSSTNGSIASNSTISLQNGTSIGGTIYYRGSAPAGGVNYVGKVLMSSAITTPSTPSAGTYASSNSNSLAALPTSGANYSSSYQNVTWPAGTYVLDSLTVGGSSTLQFSGPATIYVNGNVSVTGNARLYAYQNAPNNLQIKVTTAATVQVTGSSIAQGAITAPTSALSVTGSSYLTGACMMNTIDVQGSAGIYYDQQMGTNGAGSGSGGSGTSMVK